MTTLFFIAIAALAVTATIGTITVTLRDGYRRAPQRHPVRWYQREEAPHWRSTGSR